MPIKLKFDPNYNVQYPTFVLANRSGAYLGALPICDLVVKEPMISCTEAVFRVYKNQDGVILDVWDQIKDFKLVHCIEWDIWFEIYVEIDSANESIKNITAKSLGEAELSQIMLYDIEINTEADILRDDYSPTIIYDSENPSASLLNRIMEKAPHYTISYVDPRIARMQRTFSFSGTSLYDAFTEISTELNCLFVINSGSDSDGNIAREISVFDLESYCLDCGYRGEFVDTCPSCGSSNFLPGFGEDTTIFISTDNLADQITYSTDTGSVKNCFKLIAGDDLMTSTIINCNPNGTGYIWYISDDVKEDMSDELVDRLAEYDTTYSYYQNDHCILLPGEQIVAYNNLVTKYSTYENNYQLIPEEIVGYPSLMNAYYDTIDLNLYLSHGMMPDVDFESITASAQANILTKGNIPYVSVQNISSASSATVSNAILSFAKIFTKRNYQIRLNSGTLNSNNSWTGNFVISSFKDENDTAISPLITVPVNDNIEYFLGQRLKKELYKCGDDDVDIVGAFDKTGSEFDIEVEKYSLARLISFRDACQACLDILIEHGAGNKSAWAGQSANPYENLYSPYRTKLAKLNEEIAKREAEIAIIEAVQEKIEAERNLIQETLDFQKFMGDDLWLEFVAYRRDDSYQNDNYVSDGLNNAELFNNALEFIEVAKKEIFRSATLQHSITATLKNLLAMKEFRPIVDYFEVGNWIRVSVDGEIYRLRLIDIELDFNDLKNIRVTFSDVKSVSDGISDIESILNQAASMSTSYGYVARQAEQGKNGNETLSNWVAEGLDLTNMKIMNAAENQDVVWDSHGMLFRKYDPITEDYEPCQLKIVNSTMAITDDDWETVKTAIGKYYYVHPETKELTMSFGINAETLVGKFILGEYLGIYNETGSLSFDSAGLSVTNGSNSFRVDPDPEDGIIFAVSNSEEDVLFINEDGNISLNSDYVSFTSSNGNMSFGTGGLEISNSKNTFYVDPAAKKLVRITKNSSSGWGGTTQTDIFYVDSSGNLYVSGNISGTISGTGKDLDISNNGSVSSINTSIRDLSNTTGSLGNTIDSVTTVIGGKPYLDGTKITEGSIGGATIKDGAIQAKHITSGTITASQIQAGSITADRIVGNSITADQIATNAITADEIKAGAITAGKIATDAVESTNIKAGAITSGKIAAEAITAGKIKAGAITADHLQSNIIETKHIKSITISASNITTGTLSAKDIGITGAFTIKKNSTATTASGRIGYMSGISEGETTDGVGVSDNDIKNYLLVTNAGIRLTANDEGNNTNSFYVTPQRVGSTSEIYVSSDMRVKNSISYDIGKYESFFSSLKPAQFKYNRESNNRLHTGFIAQDVHQSLIDNGLSIDDFSALYAPVTEKEIYQIAYSEFIALNTHMIQKLMSRVDKLEQEVL